MVRMHQLSSTNDDDYDRELKEFCDALIIVPENERLPGQVLYPVTYDRDAHTMMYPIVDLANDPFNDVSSHTPVLPRTFRDVLVQALPLLDKDRAKQGSQARCLGGKASACRAQW